MGVRSDRGNLGDFLPFVSDCPGSQEELTIFLPFVRGGRWGRSVLTLLRELGFTSPSPPYEGGEEDALGRGHSTFFGFDAGEICRCRPKK